MGSIQSFDDVRSAAMSLTKEDRAKLAEQLLDSVDLLSDEEFDAAWADEAEKRARDVREGKSITVPGEVVEAKIRKFIES